MAHVTEKYKRSFSGSVGAGMGSLFNAAGKKYFILEHKVTTKYHKAGESQKIIVDQIELGRDPYCQIRFDETFGTVSRRHAAIVKDGENYKLVQLSNTNTTFLNGRPIQKEWYLQSGDEIQLSVNGPKLGFIIPQGKQSLVSSINFTERFSLFRQQALKPYKKAITILSVILILAIGGLVTWNILEHRKWTEKELIAKAERQRIEDEYKEEIGRMHEDNALTDSILKLAEQKNNLLKKQINNLQTEMNNIRMNVSGEVDDKAIEACLEHVFYIRVEKIDLIFPDGSQKEMKGSEYGWSGTGFMLEDGRFITARHVIEGWQNIQIVWNEKAKKYESNDPIGLNLNIIANNGGKVLVHFGAYTCNGRAVTFTNEDFVCNRTNDKIILMEKTGDRLHLAPLDYTDWAYIPTKESKGLKCDISQSSSLKRGTKLTVLGYPRGYVTQNIQPLSGSGVVAFDGLDNGVILTTETNYEQGNSGGPVFYASSGKLQVIGIVSAGLGRTVGFIIPMSAIK